MHLFFRFPTKENIYTLPCESLMHTRVAGASARGTSTFRRGHQSCRKVALDDVPPPSSLSKMFYSFNIFITRCSRLFLEISSPSIPGIEYCSAR